MLKRLFKIQERKVDLMLSTLEQIAYIEYEELVGREDESYEQIKKEEQN